jgi:hypothetical protein
MKERNDRDESQMGKDKQISRKSTKTTHAVPKNQRTKEIRMFSSYLSKLLQ